jgi:hypothetical protein
MVLPLADSMLRSRCVEHHQLGNPERQCCLAQHPADRRRPTCWQIPLPFDAGTTLLVAGVVTGAGLELTVTRPMTKATLTRTTMTAVTRRIRRARPVVSIRAGTVLEGTVMMLPFLLLFQFGLPPGLACPTAFQRSDRALWSVWAGQNRIGYPTFYGYSSGCHQAYPETYRQAQGSPK